MRHIRGLNKLKFAINPGLLQNQVCNKSEFTTKASYHFTVSVHGLTSCDKGGHRSVRTMVAETDHLGKKRKNISLRIPLFDPVSSSYCLCLVACIFFGNVHSLSVSQSLGFYEKKHKRVQQKSTKDTKQTLMAKRQHIRIKKQLTQLVVGVASPWSTF